MGPVFGLCASSPRPAQTLMSSGAATGATRETLSAVFVDAAVRRAVTVTDC